MGDRVISIERAVLKERRGDMLIFEKDNREYPVSSQAEYINDDRPIPSEKIGEKSEGTFKVTNGIVREVRIKKIIARKEPGGQIVCYSHTRTSLSEYIVSARLPRDRAAYLKVVEAKHPFLRQVAVRKGFQAAFGLGLLEHYARNQAEVAQFAGSVGDANLLAEFCKDGNKEQWIKNKHNSQALHLTLSSYIETAVEGVLLREDSPEVREELRALKDDAVLPSDRILQTIVEMFGVDLTVYNLTNRATQKFKRSYNKREVVYILVTADNNFLLLTSRAQLAAEKHEPVAPR